MTAPNYCVLEGDPTNGIAPRFPDALCEDMGGLQFQDDPADPPRPNEHVSAKDFKQIEMLMQRAWRMLPVLTIEFSVSGTTVTVTRVSCVKDSITTSSITAVRVSAGYYTFAWTAGTFQAARRYPRISASNVLAQPTLSTRMTLASKVAVGVGDPTNNGFTADIAGTYSIDIWGEGL